MFKRIKRKRDKKNVCHRGRQGKGEGKGEGNGDTGDGKCKCALVKVLDFV